jgi:hypothetical protein
MAPSRDDHRRKWKVQSPLGLLAVGAGASLLGHATLMKGDDAPTWKWVAAGTASLVVLNAGLSLFGDAVKHRTLHEVAREAPETAREASDGEDAA